jgi:hypothetical protein
MRCRNRRTAAAEVLSRRNRAGNAGDEGTDAAAVVLRAGPCFSRHSTCLSLEELDRALVLFGILKRYERAEISAFARLRVDFSGVETVLARFQFSDHRQPRSSSDCVAGLPRSPGCGSGLPGSPGCGSGRPGVSGVGGSGVIGRGEGGGSGTRSGNVGGAVSGGGFGGTIEAVNLYFISPPSEFYSFNLRVRDAHVFLYCLSSLRNCVRVRVLAAAVPARSQCGTRPILTSSVGC